MLLGGLVGPFPGWLRVCPGLSAGAFGSGWAWGPLISWAHRHPVAVSSGVGAGGGSGHMGLAVACVHPTEAWLSGSTGYRTPASLGKRARPGWAAPGVSQYPPHPFPSLAFITAPPPPGLPLLSLPLGVSLIFGAGRRHGRTSYFLSLTIRAGHLSTLQTHSLYPGF